MSQETDHKPGDSATTSPKSNGGSATATRPLSPYEKIGLLLTIASFLLSAAALVPGWGRIAAEFVVVLFLIGMVLWFEERVKKYVKGLLPSVLIIILAGVVFDLSFQVWMKSVPPPPNKGDKVGSVPNDRWTSWENNVTQAIKKCPSTDDTCIAGAISSNNDYPRSNSPNSVDQLNADIHAGSVLMNIEEAFHMLERNIGVKRNFLGDGLALPNNDPSYWKPRVPEYLVVNLLEDNPNLWTWELPLNYNSKRLKEIIEGPPRNDLKEREGQQDFLKAIQDIMKTSNPAQVVVRFNRFPPEKYKQSLGQPGAKRVFVLRLRDVYDLTFQEAENLSGHSRDDDPRHTAKDKLWVWVYRPTAANELGPPTWGEIIPNIKDWVAK